MSKVYKIRFPGGLELNVPHGMTADEFMNRHLGVSLTEGLCPYHQMPLAVAQEDSMYSPGSGLPWLYHPGCPWYWQIDSARERWTQETASAWLGYPPDLSSHRDGYTEHRGSDD